MEWMRTSQKNRMIATKVAWIILIAKAYALNGRYAFRFMNGSFNKNSCQSRNTTHL